MPVTQRRRGTMKNTNRTARTRREFLQSAAGFAALSPMLATRAKPHPPFVDGLCLAIAETDDNDFPASGLSGLIADVSSVSQVKTSDGSIRYTRTFEACLKSIVEARQRLRKL